MNKTLGEIVVESKLSGNYEDVAVLFYELNSDMKSKHFKGLCVNSINSDTGVDLATNSFSETRDIYDACDVRKNIEDLSLFAISSFVFLNSDVKDFVSLDRNVVADNVDFIKEMIPSLVTGDNYHTDIIEGKVFTYYEDYVMELRNSIGHDRGNSNNLSKSYSTPAGRALTDKSNYDAAFVNVIFYPVLLASILIFIAVIMVIINVL